MKLRILFGVVICVSATTLALAQSRVAPSVANPCPRAVAGSVVRNPPSLFSTDGVLRVNFSYQTRLDSGRTLFCFMTPDGLENPTLQVKPGDHLIVTVTNNVPASRGMSVAMSGSPC